MNSHLATDTVGSTPPIEIEPQDWAVVTRVLQEQVPTLEVWAFGSRARHCAKPYSDLDLALITPAPLSLENLANLSEAFDTSDLPIRVDVVVRQHRGDLAQGLGTGLADFDQAAALLEVIDTQENGTRVFEHRLPALWLAAAHLDWSNHLAASAEVSSGRDSIPVGIVA